MAKTQTPKPNPVPAGFGQYLTAQKMDVSSVRTFEYGVRRTLNSVPDINEETLTEFLYSLGSNIRSNIRLSWRYFVSYNATLGKTLPLAGYRGKGIAIKKAMKASSADGLRRHHAKIRAEKAEKSRKGRILLALTDGTTIIGDVEDDSHRIVLNRAVIMQADGQLGKLPGKASIPAARESYRVQVGMDYQVPK